MKIFGINFTTKKELKATIRALEVEVCQLKTDATMQSMKFDSLRGDFPFDLGQTVYDVALKNASGKYTKTKPSREHSTITETVVTAKNYFGLVDRLNRNDVFFTEADAKKFLDSICK